MSGSEAKDWREEGEEVEPGLERPTATVAGDLIDAEDAEEPRFFEDPKRLAQTAVFVTVIVVAIYFLVPQAAGFEDGLEKLGEGNRVWLGVAFLFGLLMFGSYVALFRGVVGERVHLTW